MKYEMSEKNQEVVESIPCKKCINYMWNVYEVHGNDYAGLHIEIVCTHCGFARRVEVCGEWVDLK